MCSVESLTPRANTLTQSKGTTRQTRADGLKLISITRCSRSAKVVAQFRRTDSTFSFSEVSAANSWATAITSTAWPTSWLAHHQLQTTYSYSKCQLYMTPVLNRSSHATCRDIKSTNSTIRTSGPSTNRCAHKDEHARRHPSTFEPIKFRSPHEPIYNDTTIT